MFPVPDKRKRPGDRDQTKKPAAQAAHRIHTSRGNPGAGLAADSKVPDDDMSAGTDIEDMDEDDDPTVTIDLSDSGVDLNDVALMEEDRYSMRSSVMSWESL